MTRSSATLPDRQKAEIRPDRDTNSYTNNTTTTTSRGRAKLLSCTHLDYVSEEADDDDGQSRRKRIDSQSQNPIIHCKLRGRHKDPGSN